MPYLSDNSHSQAFDGISWSRTGKRKKMNRLADSTHFASSSFKHYFLIFWKGAKKKPQIVNWWTHPFWTKQVIGQQQIWHPIILSSHTEAFSVFITYLEKNTHSSKLWLSPQNTIQIQAPGYYHFVVSMKKVTSVNCINGTCHSRLSVTGKMKEKKRFRSECARTNYSILNLHLRRLKKVAWYLFT